MGVATPPSIPLGAFGDRTVYALARMDENRVFRCAPARLQNIVSKWINLFAHRRHPERPMRFEGAVLTSVVPQITGALAECARHYTGRKPVIVSPEIRTGLTMGVDEPHAVGKDRLVDAAYAAANFPLPVVTVDLGTATTFNVVDGTACSGAVSSARGFPPGCGHLGDRCAQLPQVHLGSP